MKRHLVIMALFFVITACALPPRDTGRAHMFNLLPATAKGYKPLAESIVVDYPTATTELDTFRVALIRDDGKFDYYAGTRWVEFLPSHVQDTMVVSLDSSNLFDNAVAERAAFVGSYLLKSEIREFNAAYIHSGEPPVINTTISFILQKGDRRTTVDTFTLHQSVLAEADTLEAIQHGFQQAFTRLQKDVFKKIKSAVIDDLEQNQPEAPNRDTTELDPP